MRIENLTKLLPTAKEMRADAREVGLTVGAKRELSRLGIPLKINLSDRTRQVLLNDPVLIIGDHSGHYLGTIELLGAVPEREDIYVLGDSVTCRFYLGDTPVKNFLKIEGVMAQPAEAAFSKLLRLGGRVFMKEKETAGRAGPLANKESYLVAAQKLTEGHAVTIWPDGARGPKAKWTKRLGELVNSLPAKTKTQIVMEYADNNSSRALLKVLPGIRRLVTEAFLQDQVFFGEPILVSDIRTEVSLSGHPARDSRLVTEWLQEWYNGWVKSLNIEENGKRKISRHKLLPGGDSGSTV